MFPQLFLRLLWEQSSTLNAENRQESQDYWGQMERSEPESPLVEGLPMKSLKHCKKPLLLKKTCKGKNGIGFSHLLFSFFNPYMQLVGRAHNLLNHTVEHCQNKAGGDQP